MAVQVNNFQWELIFHCLLQTTKKLWSFMIIKCNKWNYQLSKIFLLIMALWKTRYLRWGRSIFLSKTHVSCWKIQNNQQLFSFIMWTFAIIVYSKLLSNCWLGTYTVAQYSILSPNSLSLKTKQILFINIVCWFHFIQNQTPIQA